MNLKLNNTKTKPKSLIKYDLNYSSFFNTCNVTFAYVSRYKNVYYCLLDSMSLFLTKLM